MKTNLRYFDYGILISTAVILILVSFDFIKSDGAPWRTLAELLTAVPLACFMHLKDRHARKEGKNIE